MRFHHRPNPETDLTDGQILQQCKMYIAALRIADDFGCDAIGIQYQQGLKDLAPASDLAEGLLNNVDRPPVASRTGQELYAGRALPHFNEVDECSGLDALITNRIWTKLGYSNPRPHCMMCAMEKTGTESLCGSSKSAGPRRLSICRRLLRRHQRASTSHVLSVWGWHIKGVSKPGEIVWSRIFVEKELSRRILGRARSVEFPAKKRSAAGASQRPCGPSCMP